MPGGAGGEADAVDDGEDGDEVDGDGGGDGGADEAEADPVGAEDLCGGLVGEEALRRGGCMRGEGG